MTNAKARTAVYLSVCLSVFTIVCQGQVASDNRLSSQEERHQMGFIGKDLTDALEGLLEEDHGNRISLEKKASVIPRCDVGERCAMKHGPRIGRLCDCLRGTACNTFFLRCY